MTQPNADALQMRPSPRHSKMQDVAKLRESALNLLKSLARVNLCGGAI